jgi:muramoyltetrapeptide carboxypeptidase
MRCYLFAPAAAFSNERLQQAQANLRPYFSSISYQPMRKAGYFAGSKTARWQQLHDILMTINEHGETAWLMAVRGGYGTIALLETFQQWSLNSPVYLSGFSDISLLLNTHRHDSHFHPVYGLNALATFAGDISTLSQKYVRLILQQPDTYDFAGDIDACLSVINPGGARAPIGGGCLSVLLTTLGTPLWPGFSGRILFLEDINEPVYRIDRMLQQLEMAGALADLAGVILGDFHGCGAADERHNLWQQYFYGRPYPVIAGFPMGHGVQQVPLLWHKPVRLKADEEGQTSLRYH